MQRLVHPELRGLLAEEIGYSCEVVPHCADLLFAKQDLRSSRLLQSRCGPAVIVMAVGEHNHLYPGGIDKLPDIL